MGGSERRVRKYFNGQRIRELRKDRQLSQQALAEMIGTKKANVSKWERSRREVDISYKLFLALATALYKAPEVLAKELATPPSPNAPVTGKASAGPIRRPGGV